MLRKWIVLGCIAAMSSACFGTDALRPESATSKPSGDAGRQMTVEPGSQTALRQRDQRYCLRPGDTFELVMPITPEFNQSIGVQPDGFITVTGLGDLHAAGLTLPELRGELERRYAATLHEPVIQIIMKDFEKPYFIASGEVGHPGKYDLRDDTTLTEAVALAGGFTPSSKHSEVFVFRRVSSQWVQVARLDVKKMMHTGNLAEDVHLRAGDMFFVPQNKISKVSKYIPTGSMSMPIPY